MSPAARDSHDKILFKDESYAIQGAIIEVYRELGCGFLEAVYQECLERELALRAIPFVSRPALAIRYKGELLKQTYQPDVICCGTIILELKAVRELAPEHQAQVLNYLKVTGLRLGLLVNFASHPQVTIKRFVR
jgi:GxxExxY protein